MTLAAFGMLFLCTALALLGIACFSVGFYKLFIED